MKKDAILNSEIFDVIVVGYGFAGAISAITASDEGAHVLLLEKMPFPGGISMTSGGGFAVGKEVEGVYLYLTRTNLNTTPDSVNRAMARGMTELPQFIRYLEEKSDIKFGDDMRSKIDPGSHNLYPFPGAESISSMKIGPDTKFKGFPWCRGMRGGARLFKLVMNNVEARNIEVRLNSPVHDLITDNSGCVIGVRSSKEGTSGKQAQISYLARRGVILACGGFENNDEMKRQFLNLQPVYYVVANGNTGDGIKMAQKAGAKLWHMWHFHGSYGFKFPEYDFAFRHSIAGPRVPSRKMPWILLDKYGNRFMNEYPFAVQDTPIRDLSYYDPERQEYPRIPAILLFDEEGRKTRPVGFPIFTGMDCQEYQWSEDNLKEVEKGWIHRAASLEDLAEQLNMPQEKLKQTLHRWNNMCEKKKDEDYERLPGTMMPIVSLPFYWMESWPIVNNTQGGPVHDEFQRVVSAGDVPIPRLYAAGELGSLFGHLYMEAGNVAECFVSGRIAGKHVTRLTPLNITDL
ncbi:MAG: FAD-binding protein [Deltaproteobacteria bacterium]|nr:FAD-binding protein [Deltaproteobacteria bacterium]